MSGDWAPHICAYCGKPGDLYGGWWNGREIYFCGDYHMREFHREKEAMENSAAADSLIDGVVGGVVDAVCSFPKITGFLGNSVKKGINGIKNYRLYIAGRFPCGAFNDSLKAIRERGFFTNRLSSSPWPGT